MKTTKGRQRAGEKDTSRLRAERILPLDSKGRISIGRAAGILGYRVVKRCDDKVVLQAMAAVPAHEAWLYANKRALASVLRGLRQSGAGQARAMDTRALAGVEGRA